MIGLDHRDSRPSEQGFDRPLHRDRPSFHQGAGHASIASYNCEVATPAPCCGSHRPHILLIRNPGGEGERPTPIRTKKMRHVVPGHCAAPARRDCTADPRWPFGKFFLRSRPPRARRALGMSRNSLSRHRPNFACARSRGTSPNCSSVPSASAASIETRGWSRMCRSAAKRRAA